MKVIEFARYTSTTVRINGILCSPGPNPGRLIWVDAEVDGVRRKIPAEEWRALMNSPDVEYSTGKQP